MDSADETASSIDDAGGSDGVWRGVGPKPWWFDDPEILAARRRVLEEFGGQLGEARDDLARARTRYAEAIRSARDCGLSWGEIGSVLGVPRQLLHRRYARRLGSRRGTIER